MKKNGKEKAKIITQDDVAQKAGVTRSVVSYVLNGNSRSVAPETRERVLLAIEELGYRPNKFAQGLMTGRSNPLASRQIGIILNNASVFLRPYYAEIIAGIHEKAHEIDYHINFIRFFDELSNPMLFNNLIHNEEVCGLILIALDQSIKNKEDSVLIDQIRERIDNIVCVEWQHPGLASISFNRLEAALMACRCLLEQGYTDLAYLGQEDQRISGFKQALIEAGLSDHSQIPIISAKDMHSGYDAAMKLVQGHKLPRALVCGCDEIAIGAMRLFSERSIRIPEDLAIISIDNIEMSEFTAPPLTTINVPKADMGRHAVSMLARYDKEESSRLPVSAFLPISLVKRQSS